MTTVIRRPARFASFAAAMIALVMVLTSCGSGPSKVNAAVIINDRVISVDRVQQVIDRVVAEQPAAKPLAEQHKLDLVSREAVSQFIMHELLALVAEREGIEVDSADVTAAMAEDPLGQELPTDGSVPPDALATQLVYRARDTQEVIGDQLILQELAQRNLSGGLTVTMDYTSASDRATAEDKASKFVENPADIPSMIESDASNQTEAIAGAEFPVDQLAQAQGQAEVLSTVMFGAQEGSVVMFQPLQGQEFWVVGMITERSVSGSGGQTGQPQLDPTQLAGFGERMAQPYYDELDVEISPRYGVWDPVLMGVAPDTEQQAGMLVPPSDIDGRE